MFVGFNQFNQRYENNLQRKDAILNAYCSNDSIV